MEEEVGEWWLSSSNVEREMWESWVPVLYEMSEDEAEGVKDL